MHKWYQEPWMWLVVGIPAATVAAGFITLWVAMHNADTPVIADYYREGLAINERIEARRVAQQLGIKAVVTLSHEDTKLNLTAPDLPDSLSLVFAHPTDEKRDRHVTLRYDPKRKIFSGPPVNISGRYYVRLQPIGNEWMLMQEVIISPNTPLSLEAQ